MISFHHSAALVVVMALVTMLLRFLPFLIFRKGQTPDYITYLGNVLPQAIIGMLVIYCLKDTVITRAPFGLPELIASLSVVFLQVWRRNSLISILSGTAVYMILTHVSLIAY